MKIGFDISDLHAGKADGTTRFTSELAKRLPQLAPSHDWVYFSSGQLSSNYNLSPGNYTLSITPWPKYWTQSRLWLDLYTHKPDVLFMPIQQLPYIRPGNMKTVCVIHDLAFHVYPEQFTHKDWLLQHVFTSYAAREADHIIAVSQATANDIAQYYGRLENVTVIHHGVDHEHFRPPASDQERAAGWENLAQWQSNIQKPYLLYVGQIQPRKNLIRLIEAFEQLQGLQLVIAGSHGWLNKSIYERVKHSSAADRILMPGRVPDQLLPALYWHAECFILPSLYEGFGMPIIEAMAAGTPVVTSNVSATAEVAGEAAVTIDPWQSRDIVHGIQAARRRRQELIAAGHMRAAQFSWDATARKALSVLQSI